MATQTRRLFVNWFTKTLQVSDVDPSAFLLPTFNKYETIPFEICIVEPAKNNRGLPVYSRVDITPLSLSVALHSGFDTSAPLAYQTTWDKDEINNVFSGELALNTVAMNTFIGSATGLLVGYFEVKIGEGTASSLILLQAVNIQNAVTQVTSSTPTPLDEYLTKAQTTAQFAAKMGRPGEQFTLTSPGNIYQRVIGVDDGGNVIDQVLPV